MVVRESVQTKEMWPTRGIQKKVGEINKEQFYTA